MKGQKANEDDEHHHDQQGLNENEHQRHHKPNEKSLHLSERTSQIPIISNKIPIITM